MLDMIIRGGQVVAPEGAADLDVGIQDGRIAVVAAPGTLDGEAGRIIDATGMIVFPGGIEPHTHIGIPVPKLWAGRSEVITQPPEAASRAAAFGGVTTLIDFAGNLAITPPKVGARWLHRKGPQIWTLEFRMGASPLSLRRERWVAKQVG